MVPWLHPHRDQMQTIRKHGPKLFDRRQVTVQILALLITAMVSATGCRARRITWRRSCDD